MRELHCADAGFDCDGVVTGENDDEVMRGTADHVAENHPGVTLDEETRGELRELIHDAS